MENHPRARSHMPPSRFLGLPDLINYRRSRIGLIADTITCVRLEPRPSFQYSLFSLWSGHSNVDLDGARLLICVFSLMLTDSDPLHCHIVPRLFSLCMGRNRNWERSFHERASCLGFGKKMFIYSFSIIGRGSRKPRFDSKNSTRKISERLLDWFPRILCT